MRWVSLIIATVLLVTVIPWAAVSVAHAQVPTPTLNVFVYGETNRAGEQVFVPDQILIPQVPIHLIVTFHNNDTPLIDHTFTINDATDTPMINTDYVTSGQNATVEFTVVTMTRITLTNGTSVTPEPANVDEIMFYCIPHRGAGMTGEIVLASVQPASPEKGILLRAYWIGIIGIAVTLGWVVITYFVIKSSSRHFVDHSEHVRKGLP